MQERPPVKSSLPIGGALNGDLIICSGLSGQITNIEHVLTAKLEKGQNCFMQVPGNKTWSEPYIMGNTSVIAPSSTVAIIGLDKVIFMIGKSCHV